MELSYDWKIFQLFFIIKDHFSFTQNNKVIFVILNQNVVVSGCSFHSEICDLSEWIGATFEEIEFQFPDCVFIPFEKKKVDQWMVQSLSLSHFYDQSSYLKREGSLQFSLLNRKKSLSQNFIQNHFLLNFVSSMWKKAFPATFGIYIQLDQKMESSIFLMIQRGKVFSFHVPDFSSLSEERKMQPHEIIRFLSERHCLFVQGVFVSSEEWNQWSVSPHPRKNIFLSLQSRSGRLVPFKWSIFILIAFKAYFKS